MSSRRGNGTHSQGKSRGTQQRDSRLKQGCHPTEDNLNSLSIEEKLDKACSSSNCKNQDLIEHINNYFWRIHSNEIKKYLNLFYEVYRIRDKIDFNLWESIRKRFIQIMETIEPHILSLEDIKNIRKRFPNSEVLIILDNPPYSQVKEELQYFQPQKLQEENA